MAAVGVLLAGVLAVAAVSGATYLISEIDWKKIGKNFQSNLDKMGENWENSKENILNPMPESITADRPTTSEKKDTSTETDFDMPLTNEIEKELGTGENKDEDQKGNGPPIIAGVPGAEEEIQDKTDDGLEVNISNSTWDDWKEYLNENRKYQDELRKHYEEREDTAVERWIASARRAGVNVNLLSSIGEAASGGGIANMMDSSNEQLLEQMQLKSEELLKMLEIKFQGDKTGFDASVDLLQSLMMMGAMMGFKKGG